MDIANKMFPYVVACTAITGIAFLYVFGVLVWTVIILLVVLAITAICWWFSTGADDAKMNKHSHERHCENSWKNLQRDLQSYKDYKNGKFIYHGVQDVLAEYKSINLLLKILPTKEAIRLMENGHILMRSKTNPLRWYVLYYSRILVRRAYGISEKHLIYGSCPCVQAANYAVGTYIDRTGDSLSSFYMLGKADERKLRAMVDTL